MLMRLCDDVELNNRQSFIDFCQGLLNMNPIERWSPQQARLHPFITGEKWTKPFVVRSPPPPPPPPSLLSISLSFDLITHLPNPHPAAFRPPPIPVPTLIPIRLSLKRTRP